MRNRFCLLGIVVLLGCESSPTGIQRSLPPPTLSVTATAAVTLDTSGVPSLGISTLLLNNTDVRIDVRVGDTCPLFVRLFLNPTGQPSGHLDGSMACDHKGPTLSILPGDQSVLTRVLHADTLETFEPGMYGINVAVTTSTAVVGAWAGSVQLPLAVSP
jgi:hypothetical protein